MTRMTGTVLGAILIALTATSAAAHPGLPGHGGLALGLADGFVHPFSGWDHLLAMTGLGLWLGLTRSRDTAPVFALFAGALATGFLLGVNGLHIPFVEPGILASVLIFGLMTAAAVRLSVSHAAPIIGAFMVLHGHAHGTEAPGGSVSLFAAGFLVASFAIVGAAYMFAYVVRRPRLIRPLGVAIAGAGVILGFAA